MHQSDHFPVVERWQMHVLRCLLGPSSSHVSDDSVFLYAGSIRVCQSEVC
jgi:hypothetical protein